ncbi:hypothetical protein NJL88_11705 [Streptomyces sp. DK15]|uniref:hypothetical protein n=1 Tax=Streptomyces sp. DK15 TaxID=2957499 RepID=UPI0029A21847|nr:hypothetical protein [Streptomyces sp. DK15]MDX2390718.1 hypothetical protein [Streptomyces sp. DK15]
MPKPPVPAPPPRVYKAPAPPPPKPAPEPTPPPVVTPSPAPKPVARPSYHAPARKPAERHISPVTFTLMTAAPAVLAIVALRPR